MQNLKPKLFCTLLLATELILFSGCNKKTVPNKPAVQAEPKAVIEQRTIKTTVGKEFGVDMLEHIYPASWYLLSYDKTSCPVELVRKETINDMPSLEGTPNHLNWIFRATKPGAHRLILAYIDVRPQHKVYRYLEVLVYVAE